MRVIGGCSTAEMLWEWALAEWESSRFGHWYPDLPEVIARLRSGAPYDHAQIFDQRIATTVAHIHDPLLNQVLPARLAWRRVALEPGELGGLRTLNIDEFRPLQPDSPLLADLVAALERDPEEHRAIPLLRAYREVKESFDPAQIQGAPIILGESMAGPFHIMEGHRRLASLLARFTDGRLPPQEVEVILGIWPQLKTWRWYHDVGAAYQPAK